MEKIEFNHGWTCRAKSETKEIPITLPHDAMICEKRTEKSLAFLSFDFAKFL